MGTLATIRQDIFNDGVKEGFSNGKIAGIRDGIRSSVKRLLEYKLNCYLSLNQMEMIENASVDKLEEIQKNIFEITSWEEVEAILKS